MKIFKQKNSKGFTLIELLVVVAIISLLSSIVFASLNTARAKARDAKRLSDIQQIQISIEMFISTHGYPPQLNGNLHDWDGNDWMFLKPDLVPTYISELPKDPFVGKYDDINEEFKNYGYMYLRDSYVWSDLNSDYTIQAGRLELTGKSFISGFGESF